MSILTFLHTDVLLSALEFFLDILSHDFLSTHPTAVPTSYFPVYSAAIQDVLEKNGQAFVACVLSGMIGDFPEDCLSSIIVIFRMLASVFPAQMSAWIQNVAPTLPVSAGLVPARQQFVTEITTCVLSCAS